MTPPTREEIVALQNSLTSVRDKHKEKSAALVAAANIVRMLQVDHTIFEWHAQLLYWELYASEAVDNRAHDARNTQSALRLFRSELHDLVDKVPRHLLDLNRLATKQQELESKFRETGFAEGLPGTVANADVAYVWSNLQADLKWMLRDIPGIEQIDKFARAAERSQKNLKEIRAEFNELRKTVLGETPIADQATNEMLDRLQALLDAVETTEDDATPDAPPTQM